MAPSNVMAGVSTLGPPNYGTMVEDVGRPCYGLISGELSHKRAQDKHCLPIGERISHRPVIHPPGCGDIPVVPSLLGIFYGWCHCCFCALQFLAAERVALFRPLGNEEGQVNEWRGAGEPHPSGWRTWAN